MEHGVMKNKESLSLEDHKKNSINKRKRKTERVIKNGQSRVTGNIGYTRQKMMTKKKKKKEKATTKKTKNPPPPPPKKKPHTQHSKLKRRATKTGGEPR